MAFVVKDRVRDTTTTTGTGTITLSGSAPSGYQSFGSALANGDTCYYTIASQAASEWETGLGTYTSAGTTLARTTVFESSNAGAAVNFGVGTKDVWIDLPASRAILKNGSGTVNGYTLTAGTTALAPLTYTSGTNLTTATAGATEYDGKVFYDTPQGTQRGVRPSAMTFRLNADLAGSNATGAQSLFAKSITLSGSTIYRMRIVAGLIKSAGTTSHTISIGFGGTATLNNIIWTPANPTVPVSSGFAASQQSLLSAATAVVATNAITTAAIRWPITIDVTVSINASGTFIPQYTLSAAPGGAYSTAAGSIWEIWPIGASGADINVGGFA